MSSFNFNIKWVFFVFFGKNVNMVSVFVMRYMCIYNFSLFY